MKTRKLKSAKDKEAELKMLGLHAKHLWAVLDMLETRARHVRQMLMKNGQLQDKLSASLARRPTRRKKE